MNILKCEFQQSPATYALSKLWMTCICSYSPDCGQEWSMQSMQENSDIDSWLLRLYNKNCYFFLLLLYAVPFFHTFCHLWCTLFCPLWGIICSFASLMGICSLHLESPLFFPPELKWLLVAGCLQKQQKL